MSILNDGNVDSVTNLQAGKDSNGKALNFKQQEDGSFMADGEDGKRYSITVTQAKVSVSDIPEKEKQGQQQQQQKTTTQPTNRSR